MVREYLQVKEKTFMKIGNLEFSPIMENKNIVSKCIYDFVSNCNNEEKSNFLVAKINSKFADGNKLCEQYNVDKKIGFNCLIVECKRNDIVKYCALVVPIGYKYNMGSIVRKYTNSRVVSVAPLDYVLEKTGMEYGSITPIGLPDDWMILVDPLIKEQEQIIIGGGLVTSKISLPTELFLKLPNVQILEGVAKQI
jgi:prolyl-tRNA editing enzyme YbaK/EbsC (Cys-tRNA(Pro) deacylase)